MIDINALTYNNHSNFKSFESNSDKQETASSTGNDKRIAVDAKLSDSNVTEGDKSQNSVEVEVQGPNNAYSAEFSREQLMQGLENNFNRQAIDRAIDSNSNDNQNSVKQAALLNSDKVSDDTSEAIVQAKYTQNAIDTYTNVSENANQNTKDDDSDEDAQQTYLDYQKQQQKQDVFFGRVDARA